MLLFNHGGIKLLNNQTQYSILLLCRYTIIYKKSISLHFLEKRTSKAYIYIKLIVKEYFY